MLWPELMLCLEMGQICIWGWQLRRHNSRYPIWSVAWHKQPSGWYMMCMLLVSANYFPSSPLISTLAFVERLEWADITEILLNNYWEMGRTYSCQQNTDFVQNGHVPSQTFFQSFLPLDMTLQHGSGPQDTSWNLLDGSFEQTFCSSDKQRHSWLTEVFVIISPLPLSFSL